MPVRPQIPRPNPDSRDTSPILLAMMSPPPAPQFVCCSPPALDDDALSEIFLRIPAEDPKSLVRAAAVCTSWRGVLSDDAFARLYRSFHGAPPMLGFLHNTRHERTLDERTHAYEEYFVSHFVSTASFRPPACHERLDWRALDSRHGLVLFHTPRRGEHFVICDLVTYDRWRIRAIDEYSHIMRHDPDNDCYGISWNAAVLCAKDRCDHLYCHGGPFLVALVGCDDELGITFASLYSSETSKWSDMISMEEGNGISRNGHIAVVGGKAYFQCKYTECIVEYNIGEQKLSMIDPLFDKEDRKLPYTDLVGVEDGMLLIATVLRSRLYLWSMDASPNGAGEWARRRTIELEPVLPPRALSSVFVVGYVECIGIIFLSTYAGLYSIELNSRRSKKVEGVSSLEKVMPYMSFYTKAWGRLPTSE